MFNSYFTTKLTNRVTAVIDAHLTRVIGGPIDSYTITTIRNHILHCVEPLITDRDIGIFNYFFRVKAAEEVLMTILPDIADGLMLMVAKTVIPDGIMPFFSSLPSCHQCAIIDCVAAGMEVREAMVRYILVKFLPRKDENPPHRSGSDG